MQPGELIAERFEIERLAGAGGMGAVYRARDRLTGEPVAVKVLHDADPEAAERFVREARMLADLHHPGIVRYLAHGRTADRLYLALEWLDGVDLAQRLAKGPLAVADAIGLLAAVADAVGAAHARGVVHRDLKPSNLFLPGGRLEGVVLLDFGVARQHRTSSTLSGVVVGTPAYMAPEQAQGVRDLDARADVFSLGCVLFECLVGRPPFTADHLMALLAKILLEEAPRAGELVKGVPPALDALLARMLAKDPAARPADGRALAAELAAVAQPAPGTAAPTRAAVALTAGERRLLAVVLAPGRAEPVGGGDQGQAPTLAPATGEPDPAALAAAVAAHGGRLEQLADGSLVALVSGSGAATDQAAQAARCALALRALRPDGPVALATGRGVVAGRWPVGEVIDRAVELLRAAPRVGGGPLTPIRIDEITAGLLDQRFTVAADAAGLALSREGAAPPDARLLLGRPTPCVGRDRELGTLIRVFDEAFAEPMARAVLVTANAGVGKSRLRHEFITHLGRRPLPIEIWIGRGDPMRAGSPFGMLAQLMRWQAGLLEREPAEASQRKLRARLGRHLRGEALARVAEFVAELTGTPLGDEAASVQLRIARRDPRLLGDQMRRAWTDFVTAECEAQPVVVVLEDLHWGDLPTVTLIDELLGALRDLPLMVLALARPEVHVEFPRLWSERAVLELRLPTLTRKAGERLVRHVLGEAPSDERVAALIDAAAGNAFYLEELIRAVAEGQGDELPGTVLAMVQARLEGMEPEARRVLRAASLFGQVFWRDGVVALLGGGAAQGAVADRWLAELAEREVVTRRAQARFSDQREYVFRHALVRDAAYAMLTDGDRVLGHRLAGSWLERAGESEAISLAEHLERGGEPARAAAWYRRAAEQALSGNDLEAVIARAERGVACGAAGELLAALRVLEAEACLWRSRYADAERCALEAMALLPAGGALWCAAAAVLARAGGVLPHVERLEELAAALLALGLGPPAPADFIRAAGRSVFELLHAGRPERAQALYERIDGIAAGLGAPDPELQALLAQVRGGWSNFAGDSAGGAAHYQAAAVSFGQAGDRRLACLMRCNAGDALNYLGAHEEAAGHLREALAAAERLGLASMASLARLNLGWALIGLGELAEAGPLLARCAEEFAARAEPRMESGARRYRAALLARAGELVEAEAEARASLALSAGFPPSRCEALGRLAAIMLARGDQAGAAAAAAEAKGLLDELGRISEGDALVRLVWAESLAGAGQQERAHEAIAAARSELLARAARIGDPARRARFLEAVPEHARTLALAQDWLDSRSP